MGEDFGGSVDGVSVVDTDGTVNGLKFVRDHNGKNVTGRKRRLEMIKRGLLEFVCDDDDGNPIYRHPAGNDRGFVLSTGECIGNGMINDKATALNSMIDERVGGGERVGVSAIQRHEENLRKHVMVSEITLRERVEEYKSGLGELLDVVGFIQKNVLLKAADDSVVLSGDDVRRLKLGLDACDRVLDRLIGRPKTVSEVQHSDVFSELSKLDNEWVVESDSVTVEELDD